MRTLLNVLVSLLVLMIGSLSLPADEPRKELYDTQALTLPRLSPEETAASAKMPVGFQMQVAAKDPEVQQPIGMCWDSRGRLWVAENYTYSEREVNFDEGLDDRILILEDTDHDGEFDKRTVFSDRVKKLTSIEIGYGGVWVMAPPQLLFIPDANRDDVPDGPVHVVLDGFEDKIIRHNLANGLRWGPDGWLYGRHGIQAVSHVGVPGSADTERTHVTCGIWRWHPTRKKLDVVCTGTTNPWGHDWDANGQLFFINTVIGHLWHAIPGAHLQRMYGEDRDPVVYELMSQVADHLHFDSGREQWASVREIGVSPATDRAGGGHAHCGMMIYQGDQWPAEYRGKLFTLNYHGRRINVERMERVGAGYVGKHEPDMVFFPDQWFRGIELASGPDGSVFVLDWSDIGECHDNDGIHRHSGVIYRISYQASRPSPSFQDLRTVSDDELLKQIVQSNAWFAGQARLILAERCNDGKLADDTIENLTKMLSASIATHRLAALWTLAACGKFDSSKTPSLLADDNEHVRIQTIHLITDPSWDHGDVTEALDVMVRKETSDLVCLHLAGALQKIDGVKWWNVMRALCSRQHLAGDRDYPLMLWYALKDRLQGKPSDAVELLRSIDSGDSSKAIFGKIIRFASRYWASRLPRETAGIDTWLAVVPKLSTSAQAEVVLGLHDGLLGRTKLKPPAAWESFSVALTKHPQDEVRDKLLGLQTLFGDGVAAEKLADLVRDDKLAADARINALRSMSENRVEGTRDLAFKYVRDRMLGADAIKSILLVGNTDDAKKLIGMFSGENAKQSSIDALVQSLTARREFLKVLFEAVETGRLRPEAVGAASLRQMQMLNDPDIDETLNRLWPQTKLIGKDRIAQIHALESKLTPESIGQGDPGLGRTTWNKLCASCHKLYGQGGVNGPELTGAQRTNLRFWTENILDPSGTVAANYRVSLFQLDNGTLVTGVVTAEDEDRVTIQTVKDKVVIDKNTIEQRKTSTQSLMPEGLLDALDDTQRRDLFAYLMGPSQVEAK